MSQNPQEKNTSLVLTQQPVNRRDFLKRSSIIPAAGALSVVGGSSLLLAPTDANAAQPDTKKLERIGVVYTGEFFNPAYGYIKTHTEWWRTKTNAQGNFDVEIWNTQTVNILGGFKSYHPRTGYVWIGKDTTGERHIRCYNNADKIIAKVPQIRLECAQEHGRKLNVARDITDRMYPVGSIRRTVVSASTLFRNMPAFIYITYVQGSTTFYQFCMYAKDVASGYVYTNAIPLNEYADRVKEAVAAINAYNTAVAELEKKVVFSAGAAAVGTALGLTDTVTGVSAYGVAAAYVTSVGAITTAVFSDVNNVSNKKVLADLAIQRFQLSPVPHPFMVNQCPADTIVRF
jgi:hypothetical protein